MIKKIGDRLGLSPRDLEKFLVNCSDGKTCNRSANKEMIHLNDLTIDAFHVLADWYHDAIMELIRTKNFEPSPKYIARALGITVNEARIAVERLERLDMIEKGKDGRWQSNDYTTILETDFTSAALRQFQRKALELSLHALETVDKVDRDHTCLTLAVRRSDLPELKERMKVFRRDVSAFLQRPGKPFDEVYQIAMSAYPLTKLNEGNKTKKMKEKKK